MTDQDTCSVGPLVLVNKNSEYQCIFAEAGQLKNGSTVSLTLSSHKGMGIGKMYTTERRAGPWRYIESAGCAAETSIRVRYEAENFIKLENDDLVLDVAFWRMEEGQVVNFVGGTNAKDKTMLGGGGRDWVINNDGTISAKHHPHLVLGTKGCKVQVLGPVIRGRGHGGGGGGGGEGHHMGGGGGDGGGGGGGGDGGGGG